MLRLSKQAIIFYFYAHGELAGVTVQPLIPTAHPTSVTYIHFVLELELDYKLAHVSVLEASTHTLFVYLQKDA